MSRPATINFSLFSGIPGLLVYLGIGALLHAIIVGAQFDWTSAWTWGWLLGWPIALFVAFCAVILIGVAVLGGLFLLALVIAAAMDKLRDWRRVKAMKALRAKGLR